MGFSEATLTVRKPLKLAFASGDRIRAVYHGLSTIEARALSLLKSLAPTKLVSGPVNYHVFDLAITGDNPLLAAILINRACKSGLSVAVTYPSTADDWPYDTCETVHGGSLLLSMLGFLKLPAHSSQTSMQVIINQLLLDLGGRATTIDAGGIEIFRESSEDLILFPREQFRPQFLPPTQSSMAAAFNASAASFPRAECLPDKQSVVFARRLVRTASSWPMEDHETYQRLVERGLIVDVGSAAPASLMEQSAIKTMAEDVGLCARGAPLAGLPPA